MRAERGPIKKMQAIATHAKMTSCFSHKLNNSISKSNSVPIIQKVTSIIQETTTFFRNHHPKRNNVLYKVLGSKLLALYETRWVERHDSVLQFAGNIESIVEALNEISNWKARETSSKAEMLINSLSTCEFICGVLMLCDILTLTQPLSFVLQKKDLDLNKASEIVKIY